MSAHEGYPSEVYLDSIVTGKPVHSQDPLLIVVLTMSPAHTGPKAVLADASHAQLLAAERDRHSAATMNEMAATFGRGMTVSEEEELRQKEQETGVEMEEWRTRRMEELRSKTLDNSSDDHSDDPEGWESKVRRRRRGAVRQVDAQGLLAAIERLGWALLFIYEPVRSSFRSSRGGISVGCADRLCDI